MDTSYAMHGSITVVLRRLPCLVTFEITSGKPTHTFAETPTMCSFGAKRRHISVSWAGRRVAAWAPAANSQCLWFEQASQGRSITCAASRSSLHRCQAAIAAIKRTERTWRSR